MMWRLLQIADSAFPTGGFAHSFGLEAAAAAGEVNDVHQFARDAIWQAAHSGLPFVCEAHAGELLQPLDDGADLFLSNHVANRASRTLGRAFQSTCARVFQTRARTQKMHLAPLWGAISRELQIPLEDSKRIYLFNAARGVLSAAVRLGIVGTLESQTILASLDPIFEQAMQAPLEVAQTQPLIDLLQGTHDRLYSRLFQS